MTKLSIKGFAVALGVSWGLGMMLLGWIAPMGYGTGIVQTMASIYIGFKPGLMGGIIGGLFGFFDGAIAGAMIAYFYNLMVKKHK